MNLAMARLPRAMISTNPSPHPSSSHLSSHTNAINASMTSTGPGYDSQDPRNTLEDEIAALEARLAAAKARRTNGVPASPPTNSVPSSASSTLHSLLLLSDSALPLGSFAFSSGLESYLAHQKLKLKRDGHQTPLPSSQLQQQQFRAFLALSLRSLASAALPFVIAAHREPARLQEWDDAFDATTLCNVARRASVAQGKGLLGVWEKSFATSCALSPSAASALPALRDFQASLRGWDGSKRGDGWAVAPSAHYPPLWGVVTFLLDLPLEQSAYLFLFSHLRTIISAAVRASVLGPYQAQAVLSGQDAQDMITEAMRGMEARKVEDAGQVVPVMDLWIGRHEVLYSRIFNS